MNELWKSAVPAVLPALMVLVGILLNKSDINRLDAQMGKLNDTMDAMRDSLNGKMDAMKDSLHGDILMLVQRDGDKDTRLMRLEERSNPSQSS